MTFSFQIPESAVEIVCAMDTVCILKGFLQVNSHHLDVHGLQQRLQYWQVFHPSGTSQSCSCGHFSLSTCFDWFVCCWDGHPHIYCNSLLQWDRGQIQYGLCWIPPRSYLHQNTRASELQWYNQSSTSQFSQDKWCNDPFFGPTQVILSLLPPASSRT